ncbi:MAG: ParB-like protein [Bdellovibrionota bacterium]
MISKRLWIAFLLVMAAPLTARAELVAIDFPNLAPLQMEAGKAEAHHKAEEWLAEARANAAKSGRSLRDEVITVISKRRPKDFRVYISPDGKYRPDDGHHKVLATRELMRDYQIGPELVEWKMNVQADFRGKTWDDFASAMQQKQVGYFPPELVEQIRAAGGSPGDLFRRLPADFSKIGDSPMRTAMGALYDSLSLEGEYFKPYSQFYLGEELARDGITLKPGEESAPSTIRMLQQYLLKDPRGRKHLEFLIAMANPKDLGTIHSAITSVSGSMECLKNALGG